LPLTIGPKEILRRFAAEPAFTLIALATIATGIGANSAIFGVVNGILLKPLPYPHVDRLVSLVFRAPGLKIPELPQSPSTYFTFRDQKHSFEDLGLWSNDLKTITGVGQPEQVEAMRVTDGTLPLLGARPILGRLFTHDDDLPGAPKTVILSYGFWKHKFGGDPAVVGRRVRIDGELREIVGVLPPDFRFLDQTLALYTPFQFDRAKVNLGNFSYRAIARLKPGVTMQQCSADVARMIPIYMRSYPPPAGYTVNEFEQALLTPWVRPLAYEVVGNIGSTLWLIMGTVGLVLLIASANVANLLLVRAEGRHRELAVRAALGASWRHLAADILAESVALGIAGGALGLLIAYGALRSLQALAPGNLPRLTAVSIDGHTVLFTAAISVIAGFLFGIIPALKYAGTRLGAGLRHSDRHSSASRERHFARNGLVIIQVTLAVILLVSSGLMIRTAMALVHVQPGFRDAAHLETLQVAIPMAEIPNPEKVTRTEEAILRGIQSIHGVSNVAISDSVPMDDNDSFDPVFARDKSYADSSVPVQRYVYVSPGFFETMGTHLVAGRDYIWSDLYDPHRVAIVSEGLAREYWGSAANAIGKQVRGSSNEPWREVIGVASDIHYDGVNKPCPKPVYWPLLLDQFEGQETLAARTVKFVVRSEGAGSEAFANDLRRVVWQINPALPIANVQTMAQYVSKSLERTSFTLVMLSIAACLALLLGLIGIYGVIAYSVTQRTREIGVRIAIGAQPRQVLALFVRSGLALAGLGIAIGVVGSSALTRLMSSLLFGVTVLDVPTYLCACIGLFLAAFLASYLPSRRALQVDPAEALRAE